MTETVKVSSKGQIVIPFDIRKKLGLDTRTTLAVTRHEDYVMLKKVSIPDLKKEFERLTEWGRKFAKEKVCAPHPVT